METVQIPILSLLAFYLYMTSLVGIIIYKALRGSRPQDGLGGLTASDWFRTIFFASIWPVSAGIFAFLAFQEENLD